RMRLGGVADIADLLLERVNALWGVKLRWIEIFPIVDGTDHLAADSFRLRGEILRRSGAVAAAVGLNALGLRHRLVDLVEVQDRGVSSDIAGFRHRLLVGVAAFLAELRNCAPRLIDGRLERGRTGQVLPE